MISLGLTAEELRQRFCGLAKALKKCDELHPEISMLLESFDKASQQPWPWRWFALRRWRQQLALIRLTEEEMTK